MRYTSGGSYTSNFDFAVPRGIKLLLIANIGLFLLYFFADFFGMERLFEPFQLIPAQTVERLFFWQPFTYLFLHDPRGVSHILLNMLMLFFAGKTLEETWGFRRFLRYYFLCGIGAALCVIVYGYVMGEKQVATIGASGSIFGLLLAFGMLFPDAVILLGMIFPIKAKYAVMIMGAIAFLGTLKGGGSVSHIAHLGGMLCGFLIIRSERKGKNVLGARGGPGIVKQFEAAWRDYKLKRAKRKFEVYMNRQNKQNRSGGPYVQ